MRFTQQEYDAYVAKHSNAYQEKCRARCDEKADKESRLHEAIISHCRANGWIYLHGSMAHKTKRTLGEPDFVLLLPDGRVLFIECKGQKTKTSPAQLAMAAWMKKLSHQLHFIRSYAEFLEVVK